MSTTVNLNDEINPIPVTRNSSGKRPTLDFPMTWDAHVSLRGRTPIFPLNFRDANYKITSEVAAWYTVGFTLAIYEGLVGLIVSKSKSTKIKLLSMRPALDNADPTS